MTPYHWFLLCGFAVFIFSVLVHLILIARKPSLDDLTAAKGSISQGIAYSATLAMSPFKKETAYLHFPTYTAGVVFHLGAFLSLGWLIVHFINLELISIVRLISAGLILVSGICGILILIKRIFNGKLRRLSTPDDYFSNIIVTGFLILSTLSLVNQEIIPILFVYGTILFLYMPLGKLRHAVYFFVARFYLGLFYGKRGTWPPPKRLQI